MVEAELDAIPRAKLKATLRRLEENPEAGKPLIGPLQGCRRLRVGDVRIVYRVLTVDNEKVCEVLVIGKRRDSEVYEIAERR